MKTIKYILLSLLSSVALFTSFYNIYEGGLEQLKPYIKLSFSKPFLIVALGIIIILMFWFYCKERKSSTYNNIIAGLFTCFLIIGNGYELYGSFLELFKGYHFVLMIVNIFGYYFFMIKFYCFRFC